MFLEDESDTRGTTDHLTVICGEDQEVDQEAVVEDQEAEEEGKEGQAVLEVHHLEESVGARNSPDSYQISPLSLLSPTQRNPGEALTFGMTRISKKREKKKD